MKQKGFSLIEIVIVMAILSLFIVLVADFQSKVFVFNRIFQGGNFVGKDALNVVKSMATEIRAMNRSSNGAFPIESASTSSLVFFTDINNDGDQERIRYYLSDTTLKRGVIEPVGNPTSYPQASETTSILMSNVRNTATSSIFTYYTSSFDGSATSSLPIPVPILNVRHIVINVILDADPSKPLVPFYATTQVSLRNLKDNL